MATLLCGVRDKDPATLARLGVWVGPDGVARAGLFDLLSRLIWNSGMDVLYGEGAGADPSMLRVFK